MALATAIIGLLSVLLPALLQMLTGVKANAQATQTITAQQTQLGSISADVARKQRLDALPPAAVSVLRQYYANQRAAGLG